MAFVFRRKTPLEKALAALRDGGQELLVLASKDQEIMDWFWLSRKQLSRVEKLRGDMQRALLWLEDNRIPRKEREELLEPVQGTLRGLLRVINAVRDVHIEPEQAKHPELRKIVKDWDENPKSLHKHLELIQLRLGEIIDHEQLMEERRRLSRRRFLKVGTGAAAAGVAAIVGNKLLDNPMLKASTSPPTSAPRAIPPAKTIVQPATPPLRVEAGFYFQMSAWQTLEKAKKALASKANECVIHQANDTDRGTKYPFKLLFNKRCQDLNGVFKIYKELEREKKVKAGGVVQVLPDSSTVWLETLEDAIIEESKKELPPSRYRPLIQATLERYPLRADAEKDTRLVEAIISVESGGDPKEVSPVGARGLMQVMPDMWDSFHFGTREARHRVHNPRYHKTFYNMAEWNPFAEKERVEMLKPHTCDPFDPQQNIDAGVMLLADLFRRHYRVRRGKDDTWKVKYILRCYNGGKPRKNKENQAYAGKVFAQGGA